MGIPRVGMTPKNFSILILIRILVMFNAVILRDNVLERILGILAATATA
jgi:hypothetical protein